MASHFWSLIESARSSGCMVVGDGAMGTMLQRAGLGLGHCPEEWTQQRPDAVMDVHAAYAQAGAAWVQTNTFGGNVGRLVHFLGTHTMEKHARRYNEFAVQLARAAAPGLPVLASIGPTGNPERGCWERLFRDQAVVLAGAGVDGFVVETITSLEEGLAAVRAAVGSEGGPVVACFTPEANGNLLDGTPAETAAEEWVRAGAAVVGVNCGTGPESLLGPARRLVAAELAPVLAAPNAGAPTLVDGRPVYSLQPDGFAHAAIQFQDAGVRLYAGCCGTGPEHIEAAIRALSERSHPAHEPPP